MGGPSLGLGDRLGERSGFGGCSGSSPLRSAGAFYRLGGQEITGNETGQAAATQVVISCELRGGASPDQVLRPVPGITARLGIDQQPVLLTDPEQRAWLEAFIWPEDVDGLATLRGAISLALSTGRVPVMAGDAVADTARLLAELPGDEPVAVFTATLLTYLGADARAAFLGQLDEAARHRPAAWIFAEAPGLVAPLGLDIPALRGPLRQRNALSAVGASLRGAGPDDDSLLAMAHPYLRWLAPAREQADDFDWLAA